MSNKNQFRNVRFATRSFDVHEDSSTSESHKNTAADAKQTANKDTRIPGILREEKIYKTEIHHSTVKTKGKKHVSFKQCAEDNKENVPPLQLVKRKVYFKDTVEKDQENIPPIEPSTSEKITIEKSVQFLSVLRNTTDVSVTPTDISPPCIPKIKLQHKAVQQKRTHPEQIATELIYNLAYRDENLEYETKKLQISLSMTNQNITPQQRVIIINFVMNLSVHYAYPSFITYEAIHIFDSYLCRKKVETEKLQLAILAAMWIALKKDFSIFKVPPASKMISFAGGYYKEHSLLHKCEIDILATLDWMFHVTDPFSIIAYYISNYDLDVHDPRMEKLYYCASYLIDLSAYKEALLHHTMLLITAAIQISSRVVLASAKERSSRSAKWSTCSYFTKDKTIVAFNFAENDINPVRKELLRLVLKSGNPEKNYHTVYKKYTLVRYGGVAKFLLERVQSLQHG